MPEGHHGTRGRPRKIIDPDRVLSLFKQGLTVPEVAHVLHIWPRNLIAQIKANASLLNAVNAAHAEMLAEMTGALRKKALTGHAPSMKMLLERMDQSRIK